MSILNSIHVYNFNFFEWIVTLPDNSGGNNSLHIDKNWEVYSKYAVDIII